MASYPRQVPAGGEGKISVKVNTSGYGGRVLKKKIAIHTDDKNKPISHLVISGKVKLFAKVSPRYARLSGEIGTAIQTTVKIKKEKAYPFTITEIKAKSGQNIKYSFTPYEKPGESGYHLIIENLKKEKGRYADTLMLHTDSKVKPVLKVAVYGFITEPATKTPPPEKKK